MDNKHDNIPNDEKKLENESLSEKEVSVEEPDNITREINLDELYDGAVNNTVVIDPVTNDEVLLPSKKPNYTLLGIILAIIVLLVLYYVNNKTDIGGTTKDVEPKTTTTKKVDSYDNKTGTLTCTYNSKSDAETQTVTFVANYENNVLKNSNFNYVVVSNLETTSAVIEDLKNQYENFYINNASVVGSNVTFEKNDNGFTFNSETDYESFDFDKLSVIDGQTILYVKPQKNDTYESLQEAYIAKGFSCTVTND